jgi:hypothetical protein
MTSFGARADMAARRRSLRQDDQYRSAILMAELADCCDEAITDCVLRVDDSHSRRSLSVPHLQTRCNSATDDLEDTRPPLSGFQLCPSLDVSARHFADAWHPGALNQFCRAVNCRSVGPGLLLCDGDLTPKPCPLECQCQRLGSQLTMSVIGGVTSSTNVLTSMR